MLIPEQYVVLDNLLTDEQLVVVQESLNSRMMPFYWHDDIDYEHPTSDTLNFGFSHQMFSLKTKEQSEYFPLYLPIVTQSCLRIKKELVELLRMRLVLLTNVNMMHPNRQHVDLPDLDCVTLVYYPEDTDGDFAICLDGKDVAIQPKENRCIVMFNNIGHHGSNPINHRRRVVVNANIIVR